MLFNVGAAQCALGLWAEAAGSLEEALCKGPEGAGEDLHAALAQVQVRRAGQAPLGHVQGSYLSQRPQTNCMS